MTQSIGPKDILLATEHKAERPLAVNHEKIEEAVRMILEAIGEDPQREGLVETPARVARMYAEIFSGLDKDPEEVLSTRFHVDHDEFVLVKDIPFHSACEHHLLPFYGVAHVAYLPNHGLVTGLSKLARVVERVAQRPQVQERMTNHIADAIEHALDAKGVAVMISAEHFCMSMRGVKKPGSRTVTIATRGALRDDPEQRREVLEAMRDPHQG